MYRGFNPDDLYTPESKSVTWIYYPKEGRLETAEYPKFHGYMLTGGKFRGGDQDEAFRLRQEAIDKGLILGRFGEFSYVKVISFWGNPSKDILDGLLKAIAQEYPEYAKYPNTVMVVGTQGFNPIKLSKLVPDIQKYAGQKSKKEDKPQDANDCNQLGINVDGKFMNLGQLAGNFHMVKGVNFDLMKSGFCGNKEQLMQQAKEKGCKGAEELIDFISGRANCGASTGTSTYDQAKKAGSAAYRNDLQKVFSNPSRIDTEFRGRQKDIDAAWDYLRKGRNENFSGFKQWLMSEHETQRRTSRRSR
jgi:hypothetical protein